MAAGMWQGLLAGYQDVEAKKMAREAKEGELLEKRKGLALQLAMKYGTSGVGATQRGEGGGQATGGRTEGENIEHFSRVLNTQFGVSEEVIGRVAGVSGAGGLNQAFDILERQRAKYAELGQEMPVNIVSDLFESAVMTPRGEREDIDFARLEEYIGEAFDPLERELVMASRPPQAPGQAYFPEPAVIPPPSVEDISRIEGRAIQMAQMEASRENRQLSTALNRVRQVLEDRSDPNAVAEAENIRDWIVERQTLVTEALSSNRGDNANPFGLIELYGQSFVQRQLEADPRLQRGVISPLFEGASEAMPKKVQSPQQLRSLARAGVISVGDVVELLDPETGEYRRLTVGD